VVKATSLVTADLSPGTELWLIWAYIAIDQTALAREARAEIVRQKIAGKTDIDLNVELHPSMISIAAAAFSLDGFASVVKATGVPPTAPLAPDPKRADWIWEYLRAGFDVGFNTNTWPGHLKDLFALRNVKGGGLVHPHTYFGAPVNHPVVPNVSAARAVFTTETAGHALALMRDIYATCRERVRPQHAKLASRISGLDGSPRQVVALAAP
jgi:hypothetical protein